MADKKISQLTAASTPLAGTEVLPIVQSGSTVKVSAADVTAGRAVSALSMTLTGSPLAATSGGTGQSSAFTANGVPYASSTSALATGSVLSFDGSLLSVSSAGAKAQVVSGSTNNTGTTLLVQNDNKTTGKLARFYSNNGSASNSGNLVEIVNDFNSGGTADLLYLQQDDDGNGLQIVMDRGGAGIKVTAGFGNCAEFTAGNLKFMTAGKGIDFSANTHAAGMTSELLDWYEEGTFTPTLTTTGGAFDAVTYDAITGGRYTRIGNMVHFQLSLRTDAVTVGAVTGDLIIAGLPFAAVANSGSTRDGNSAVSIGYAANFSSNEPMNALVAAGGSTIALYDRAAINGNTTAMDQSDVGTGANANEVWIAGSYICA